MYPTQTMTGLVRLAEELDESKVSPGVLGFLVFAVIGGAVWLLLRSMNKHIKRVNFAEAAPSAAPGAGGPAPAVGSATAPRTAATGTAQRRSAPAEPAPEGPGSSPGPAAPGSGSGDGASTHHGS